MTWISAVTGTALFSRRLPLTAGAAAEGQRFPWEPRPEDSDMLCYGKARMADHGSPS